jgi:hypothetical protein
VKKPRMGGGGAIISQLFPDSWGNVCLAINANADISVESSTRRHARLAFDADLCPKARLLPSTYDPSPSPSASDSIVLSHARL